MDSKILYEKDGMIFTKIDDKKYNLSFSMENKNILIANIIDFSLFKLIYELNGDIYESVNLTKINENEATTVLVMKHLLLILKTVQLKTSGSPMVTVSHITSRLSTLL